jgi:hypothetical protein
MGRIGRSRSFASRGRSVPSVTSVISAWVAHLAAPSSRSESHQAARCNRTSTKMSYWRLEQRRRRLNSGESCVIDCDHGQRLNARLPSCSVGMDSGRDAIVGDEDGSPGDAEVRRQVFRSGV